MRMIRTRDELESLPTGSIVRDRNGAVLVSIPSSGDTLWHMAGRKGPQRGRFIAYPATLLWQPGATAAPAPETDPRPAPRNPNTPDMDLVEAVARAQFEMNLGRNTTTLWEQMPAYGREGWMELARPIATAVKTYLREGGRV